MSNFRKMLVLAASFAAMRSVAPASAETAGFAPFDEFVNSLSAAKPDAFVGQAEAGVKSAPAFEEMRRHLVRMYSGVKVAHSFAYVDDVVDCIPVMQQPSVRALGLKKLAAEPPPPPKPRSMRTQAVNPGDPKLVRIDQFAPGKTRDAARNVVGCPSKTVPIRRLTLEELSGFGSLQEAFDKYPGGGKTAAADLPEKHLHAHARKDVANKGGSSDINLWNPKVGTGNLLVFSLSQHWYTNVRAPDGWLQTVEGGWQRWQKMPAICGDPTTSHACPTYAYPRLFIFYTTNQYGHNGDEPLNGCYNHICEGFRQTNPNWILGSAFQSYRNGSVDGGVQYYFTLEYLNYNGNWWLNLNGQWVGYYPGALFTNKDGTTPSKMATRARDIDFGGEVEIPNGGPRVFPAMGSGKPADKGWMHAAFHKNIYYFSNASQPQDVQAITAKGLLTYRAPQCYTISGKESTTGGWNTFFFYGGPGGLNCDKAPTAGDVTLHDVEK